MEVTDEGIVTEVSPLQFEKADSPMEVTADVITIDFNPVQKANVRKLMAVTEPVLNEVKPLHP